MNVNKYFMPERKECYAAQKDWFKELVIYQIYPRSFMDGNGDGIGDLSGMIRKLDYLKELGINAVWMSPVYASPNVDNGYDISDYRRIMEEFGTMEEWEAFRDGAHERGIAIIMDLVLNHSSDLHPWFMESRKSRTNKYSDYYIWRDPAEDGGAPNHWQSVFGGSAWEYVPERGQYYLHFFAKEQPDLNWENETAREEIFDIIRFWNEKGVDGYRIDAISYLDKGLDGSANMDELFGTASCANLAGTHRYIQEMVQKTMAPDHLVSIGEIIVYNTEDTLDYTSSSRGEFDMGIPFVPPIVEIETWSPQNLKKSIMETYDATKDSCWWTRFFSNHDKPRQVSLYGNDGAYWKESAKMLASFLHTLPGTPFVYQGEEIGMTNIQLPSIDDYDDIDTKNYYKTRIEEGASPDEALRAAQNISRDNARTPMQWDDTTNGGFTTGTPWLAVNPNYAQINAKQQMADEDSIFSFYQKLIRLRKEHPVLVHGDLRMLSEEEGTVIGYTRTLDGETWMAVHNFSGEEQIFENEILHEKSEVILTNYGRKQLESGCIHLNPYETIVLRMR